MTSVAEALPEDPDLLKAMLLAERAESERLRQIIKELQRHRFGRRAETLPEDRMPCLDGPDQVGSIPRVRRVPQRRWIGGVSSATGLARNP